MSFGRTYGRDAITSGLTFSEARRRLVDDLGFDASTHALVAYGINHVDMGIVCKILSAIDEPFIARTALGNSHIQTNTFTCLDPVSVHTILTQCMTEKPHSFALEDVHRKLYGNKPDIAPHTAAADTLLLNDIVRVLVKI